VPVYRKCSTTRNADNDTVSLTLTRAGTSDPSLVRVDRTKDVKTGWFNGTLCGEVSPK